MAAGAAGAEFTAAASGGLTLLGGADFLLPGAVTRGLNALTPTAGDIAASRPEFVAGGIATAVGTFFVPGLGQTNAARVPSLLRTAQLYVAASDVAGLGELTFTAFAALADGGFFANGDGAQQASLGPVALAELARRNPGAARLLGRATRATSAVTSAAGNAVSVGSTAAFRANFDSLFGASVGLAGVGIEQGRDALGRFLPRGVGEVAPGSGRAERVRRRLVSVFGEDAVQAEQFLRNAAGAIVRDPRTGIARRVDFAVIVDGQARGVLEVTSRTASKRAQTDRELRIRSVGGTFIRDRVTDQLINVSDVRTRLVRIN